MPTTQPDPQRFRAPEAALTYSRQEDLLDEDFVDNMMGLGDRFIDYFDAELHDADRIPSEGGALIVANHAFLACDSVVLYPLIYKMTGRVARGLGDRALFRAPLLGKMLARFGAVLGNRDNAVALLEQGQLGLCYPGGAQDSLKGPADRYRLRWERARGYLICAARAGVPIVPVVGVGIDDAYPALAQERVIGRRFMGSDRYDLPIILGLGPMPLPAKFDFYVGEPYTPQLSARDLDDRDAVEAEHHTLWYRTQALLNAKVKATQHRGRAPRWFDRFLPSKPARTALQRLRRAA